MYDKKDLDYLQSLGYSVRNGAIINAQGEYQSTVSDDSGFSIDSQVGIEEFTQMKDKDNARKMSGFAFDETSPESEYVQGQIFDVKQQLKDPYDFRPINPDAIAEKAFSDLQKNGEVYGESLNETLQLKKKVAAKQDEIIAFSLKSQLEDVGDLLESTDKNDPTERDFAESIAENPEEQIQNKEESSELNDFREYKSLKDKEIEIQRLEEIKSNIDSDKWADLNRIQDQINTIEENFTEAEREKLKEYRRPAIDNFVSEQQIELEKLNSKFEDYSMQIDSRNQELMQSMSFEERANLKTQRESMSGYRSTKELLEERSRIESALLKTQDLIDNSNSYLSGDLLYSPFSTISKTKDNLSLGWSPLVEDITLIHPLFEKLKSGEELTDGENMLNESLKAEAKYRNLGIKQTGMYNITEGATKSIGFVASLTLGSPVSSVIKQGTETLFKQGLKKFAKTKVGTAAVKNKAFNFGADISSKIASNTLATAFEVSIMAPTYSNILSRYDGEYQMVENPATGEMEAQMGKQLYNTLQAEADNNITFLKKELASAQARNNTEKVAEYTEQIKHWEGVKDKVVLQPSWTNAIVYGATETAKDIVTEKFVGPAANKIKALTLGGKTVRGAYIPDLGKRTMLGKAVDNITANPVVKGLNNSTAKKLYDAVLLRDVKKSVNKISGSNLIGGFGEEFAEEAIVNFIPTYEANGYNWDSYKEQVAETFTRDFLVTTAGVTGLMQGAFGLPGGIKNISNYNSKKNRDARSFMKSLRDANLTDSEYKNIMMKAGLGDFSAQDYNNQIQEHRLKGTPDSIRKADDLEANFYFNMALAASKAGKGKDFKRTLEAAKFNENITPETLKAMTEVHSYLETIDRNIGVLEEMENSDEILTLIGKKRYNEKLSSDMQEAQSVLNVDPEVVEGYDKVIQKAFDVELVGEVDINTPKNKETLSNYVTNNSSKIPQKVQQKILNELTIPALDSSKKEINKVLDLLTDKKFQEKRREETRIKEASYKGVSKRVGKDYKTKDLEQEVDKKIRRSTGVLSNKELVNLKKEIINTFENKKIEDTVRAAALKAFSQKQKDVVDNTTPQQRNTIAQVGSVLGEVVEDDDADFILPDTPEMIQRLADIVKAPVEHDAETPLSFPQLIDHLLANGVIDADTIKDGFKVLGKAYDTLGHGPSDWKNEYDKRYNSLKNKINTLAEFISENSIEETPEKTDQGSAIKNSQQQEITAEKTANPSKLDAHNKPKVEKVIPIPEANMESVSTTVKYSPIKTKTKVVPELNAEGNPTGRVIVTYEKDAVPQLRENGFINYTALAHPEKNNIGDTLKLEVVTENYFDDVKLTARDHNGVPKLDSNGEPVLITFNDWVIQNKPKGMSLEEFSNTDEYISKVPMVYVDKDGQRVGFVTDIESVNKVTVKDPANFEEERSDQYVVDLNNPSEFQTKEIERVKNEAFALRKSIFSGKVREVEILDNANNPLEKIKELDADGNTVLPKPLSEVAPDSGIAVLFPDGRFRDVEGNIIDTKDIINVDTQLEKKLVKIKGVNKSSYANKNKTFYISRVADVDGVPKYKMYLALRKNSEGNSQVSSQEKETIKWLLILNNILSFMDSPSGSAHLSVQGGGAPNFQGLPTLTKKEALKIVGEIKEATNGKVDLNKKKDLIATVNSIAFLQVGTGKTNDLKSMKKASTNEESIFVQNTSVGYGNIPTFTITFEDGKFEVKKTADSYEDGLKQRLSTNLMGFNVGTQSKPIFTHEPHQVVHVKPIVKEKTTEEKIEEVKEESVETPTETSTPKEVETIEETKKASHSPAEIKEMLEEGLALLQVLNKPFVFGAKKESVNEVYSSSDLSISSNTIEGLTISQQIDLVDKLVSILSNKGISATEVKSNYLGYFTEIGTILTNKISKYLDVYEVSPDTKLEELILSLGEELDLVNVVIEKYPEILDKAVEISTRSMFLTEELDSDVNEVTNYAKGSDEKFGIDKVGVEIKRIFAKISNKESGVLGVEKFDNFKLMYDNVLGILSNSLFNTTDFNTAMQILSGYKESHPWMEGVVESLRNAPEEVQNKFMYNMYQHSVQAKMVVFSTVDSSSAVQGEVWATNANTAIRKAKITWRNNFQRSAISIDGKINTATLKNLIEEWNTNFENWTAGENLQSLKQWAATFGIVLSDKTWEAMRKGELYTQSKGKLYPTPFKDLFGDSQGSLFTNLIAYASDNANREDYDYIENSKEHPFSEMGTILNQLALLETRYNPKYVSSSRRVAGKSLTEVEPTNYFYEQINKLKRSALGDKAFLNFLEETSFSGNSHTLKLLKESPEFIEIFSDQVVDILALKELYTQDPLFSGISDLSDIDYMFHQRIMFQDQKQSKISLQSDGIDLRVGVLSTPTTSDKGRMMAVKTAVYDLFSGYKSFFSGVSGAELNFTEQLGGLVYERLVTPELSRIIKFANEIQSTNIKGYDKGAMRFNLTPALNTIEDSEGVTAIEYLNSGQASAEEFKERFSASAIELLSSSMISEARGNLNTFIKEGVITETENLIHDKTYLQGNNLPPLEKALVAELDYVVNAKIGLMENMQLIAGDPALYYKSKENHLSTDPKIQEKISRELGINLGKRLASMIAPGQILPNSEHNTYTQIFLEDVVEVAEGIESLIKMFYGNGAITEEVETALDTKNIKALQEKFPKISDYFEIETTDAQEYTTVKEHLYVLEKQGKITTKKSRELQEKIAEGKILTSSELGTVFQPVKPVYTGSIEDVDQDVNRMLYIKSSSFPLLPQMLTKGSKLDKLREHMETLEQTLKTTVRASYQTANKVGANTNTVDINNPASISEILNPSKDSPYLELSRKNFKIQQEVPFKSKKKQQDVVSMGTQIFKLLFGNGILDYTGNIEYQGENLTAEELHSKFLEAYGNIIDIERAGLLTELGIGEDFSVVDQKKTAEKFQELLVSEATTRGFSQQDLDALGLVENFDSNNVPTYDFKIPLWFLANSNKYEAMLNAIITNRILKQKLPGNGFVVGSSTGLELPQVKEQLAISTSNTLSTEQKELISQSVGETTIPDCL